VVLNGHAKGLGAVGDGGPDASHAEDAEGFVLGVVAELEVAAPVAWCWLSVSVGVAVAAVEREREREREGYGPWLTALKHCLIFRSAPSIRNMATSAVALLTAMGVLET